MTSIIIPAHNEAERIGANLALLTDGCGPGELDIVVVANGCTDDTAAIAARVEGVRVIELPQAGKAAALRAGDAAAIRPGRIYLDADVPLTAMQAFALAQAVTQPDVLAATARRHLVTNGSSLAVRAFYAVNTRLPVYDDALFGRGVIALGAAGRARFDQFPDLVADDLFLDSLFAAGEKRQVAEVVTTVTAPRTTIQLVRRLARVRSGNRKVRTVSAARPARHTSWLRDVVLPRPWLWPAGACYAAVILAAEILSRRASVTWGHA